MQKLKDYYISCLLIFVPLILVLAIKFVLSDDNCHMLPVTTCAYLLRSLCFQCNVKVSLCSASVQCTSNSLSVLIACLVFVSMLFQLHQARTVLTLS